MRQLPLLLLVLSLVSTLLLAGSLSRMELQPGMPFPGSASSQAGSEETARLPAGENLSVPVMQGIFALLFLALMFYLPVRLIALRSLKSILGLVIILALLFVLISLLPRISLAPAAPPLEEYSAPPVSPATEFPVSPLGEPPQAVIWLVLAAFGTGVVILAIVVSKARTTRASVDSLEQEARSAVEALDSGRPFRDVIVQCYMRMARILREEQGMQRGDQMTVREFEALLESRGVPAAPVHQLTSLFEKVRYGRQAADEEDRKLGMECLDQIIRFCGRGGVATHESR